MKIKIYNTLSRKKEELKPLNPKKVTMFVCGPTVYDYTHIGHAKTYIQFDVIAKYLKYRKIPLFYLQNITDIDDKIIKKAEDRGQTSKELAEFFERAYYEDMKTLKVTSVDKYARATDYIDAIISQVKRLIEKKYAYETSDGIYYEIKKFKDYGKLSHQPLDKIIAGHRVIINEDKKNPEDFVLWKKQKPGEPAWESPWGPGRPGWHIEDTAITETEFGQQYDLHGGGLDLIFPHHEAEIAQIEAISGKKPFVKYWMHTGFVNIDKVKMSKSLKNFISIRDALKKWSPEAIRFFMISTHYRSPINFTEQSMNQAQENIDKITNFMEKLNFSMKGTNNESKKEFIQKIDDYKQKFIESMDDDFNTSAAMAEFMAIIKETHKYIDSGKYSRKNLEKVKTILEEIDNVFGIIPKIKVEIPKEVQTLTEQREQARKNKDWETADKLRVQINKKGYEIQDSEKGPILKKK